MDLAERARDYFEKLQSRICSSLEERDGAARFRRDAWSYRPGEGRPADGGGVSRVLNDGAVFEKAGVNLAGVHGALTERLAGHLDVPVQPFHATGISLVIHPRSPRVPTVHMNLRFIRLENGTAWFGGGADLTPYYLCREDATHFHRTWRAVCDRHDPAYYPRFKKWCDDYFRIKHRDEARGIGGIFFDYLRDRPEEVFRFIQDAGDAFLPAYDPIVERRCDEPWGEREREWQLIRRGRYVEFNLVYDRGTLFGLETRGRTESILMSLPPLVSWVYDHRTEPGSPETELIEVLREPVDWA